MNHQELRCGNLVNKLFTDGNGNEYWQITKVLPHDIVACSERPDDFKSVSTTEEILEAIGFKEKMVYNSCRFELGDFKVYVDIDDGLVDGHFDFHRAKEVGIKGETEFVHSLQNLYHSLSGQELNVDPILANVDNCH